MKINNNYNKFLQSLKQVKNNNKKVKKDSNQILSEPSKKSVEISFSEEAKKLSEISEKEAHSEKVETIKTAIENEQYEIQPKEIAKGIFERIKSQEGME